VVENHGQDQRRHNAGNDSGGNVTDKFEHGYFLQLGNVVVLFGIRRRAATSQVKQQFMMRPENYLKAVAIPPTDQGLPSCLTQQTSRAQAKFRQTPQAIPHT
jgi:hypothetical protein